MRQTDPSWQSPISGVDGVHFTPETGYTTFAGEHFVDPQTGNIIFHFALPADAGPRLRQFFADDFGLALSDVAVRHFKSGPPRLAASYLSESGVWGFRAGGFGLEGSLRYWTDVFYEELDREVDARLAPAPTHPGTRTP